MLTDKLQNVKDQISTYIGGSTVTSNEYFEKLGELLAKEGLIEGTYYQNWEIVGTIGVVFKKQLNLKNYEGLMNKYVGINITSEAQKDIDDLPRFIKETESYIDEKFGNSEVGRQELTDTLTEFYRSKGYDQHLHLNVTSKIKPLCRIKKEPKKIGNYIKSELEEALSNLK